MLKCSAVPILVVVSVASIGLVACDQAEKEDLYVVPAKSALPEVSEGPVPLELIHEHGVLGKLGVPLGQIVLVEAVVVDGNSLNSKAYRGSYLLSIVSVDGVPLKEGPIMEFGTTPGANLPDLYDGSHELREHLEMIAEGKGVQISDAEIEKAREDYVGSTKKLYVYESGWFRGIPRGEFPEDAVIWQDTGFQFSTHLNVLASGEGKPK